MVSDERAELRGTIVDGRYRIGATLARGGTGVVFKAERLATLETVVTKTLRPSYAHYPDLARRLRREVEVARSVFHPGIVPVIDHGDLADGTPYLVMKYMRSESLCSLLRRKRMLRADEAAVIVTAVSSILHSVHHKGYVHRDIKPEHILLNRDRDGGLEVHLLDFGVCAAATAPSDEKDRERGRVYGTPSYVSPEQASGDPNVDARADLFGLGITLFEMLSGRLPFQGGDVNSVLRTIICEDAPRVSSFAMHVDEAMDNLVAQMLCRPVQQRMPTARALMRALAPWTQHRAYVERELAAGLRVDEPARPIRPTVSRHVAAA